jgi:hypothetical protein
LFSCYQPPKILWQIDPAFYFDLLFFSKPRNYRAVKQRYHNLMMACECEGFAAGGASGASQHVRVRAVMLYHVEVNRREFFYLVPEVSGNGQRLEKDLRHYDRRATINDCTAAVKVRQLAGEDAKIVHARFAGCSAVHAGLLVDNVCADSDVHGGGDILLKASQ